jgi:hypothetical protein
MVRFACPRCKVILEHPESAAAAAFACPSCGQRLQVPPSLENKTAAAKQIDWGRAEIPDPEAAAPPPAPPPPFVIAKLNPVAAPAVPASPPPARPRRRDREYDDDYDDDFSAIDRHRARRGRYSQQASSRAASSSLVCSLVSLGLLLVTFVLWLLMMQNQFGREPSFVIVVLLMILVSLLLGVLGIVFSSRGLDQSNRYNRGQATAGLICGIIAVVIGSVVGLFFFCMGMVIFSVAGRW